MSNNNVDGSSDNAAALFETIRREKSDLFAYRQSNLPPALTTARKAHEANLRSLKSDLKKATAFVKKIRGINSEGLQQCIRDSDSLNLTLYISEIVSAVLEVTFKATDVPLVVQLSAVLHKRYEEYTIGLINGIRTSLLNGAQSAASSASEEEKESGKKKRILIRLAIELFQAGIWDDDAFFVELVRLLLGKNKSGVKQPIDVLALGTYCKYGSEVVMGIVPKRLQKIVSQLEPVPTVIPVKLFASSQAAEEIRRVVKESYTKFCADLVEIFRDLRSKERKAERDRAIHGSLTEQKQNELDNAKRSFEKLNAAVLSLSECIGEEVPVLQDEKEEACSAAGVLSVFDTTSIHLLNQDSGPWGDPETKSFYEDLPDLLSLVPLSALGMTAEQVAIMKEEWKNTARDRIQNMGLGDADATVSSVQAELAEADSESVTEDLESVPAAGGTVTSSTTTTGEDSTKPAVVEDTPQNRITTLLTEKLLDCSSKNKADEFCVAFCGASSGNKGPRKRLAAALSKIPRNRSDLVPTYARITASLARLYPELTEAVGDVVKRDFYGQMKFAKSHQPIDHRLRTIRFMGELVKFGQLPPIVVFRALTALMSEFSLQNIELMTALLENCGRFLYLLPYTHPRMEESLNTMMRLRRQKYLDVRQQALIESAYFAVKPPERVVKEKKVYTPAQSYCTFLFTERLDSPGSNVDKIIASIRRLPWNNPEENIEGCALRAVMKVVRKKYTSIPTIADCLSGLSRSFPNLVIKVVDRALDEVQRGMETPHRRDPQRMLGFARLLGELYNYRVLPSTVIFELLYRLINHGHLIRSNEPPAPSLAAAITAGIPSGEYRGTAVLSSGTPLSLPPLSAFQMPPQSAFDPNTLSTYDPPTDLLRAQLVCEILNACGQYYIRGVTREKLNRFLVYFQRYLLAKETIPLHIEFMVIDTFDALEELARDAIKKEKAPEDAKKAKKSKKASLELELVEDAGASQQFPRYETMASVLEAISLWEAKPEESKEEELPDDEDDDGEDEEDDDAPTDATDVGTEDSSIALITSESKEESGGEDDEDDEDDDSDDDDLAEDAAGAMMRSMRNAEADDEFDKIFKQFMVETVESAKTSSHKASADLNRMAIPVILPKPKNESVIDIDETTSTKEAPRMAFRMLARDQKGRLETRQLMVPETAQMCVNQAKAEEARRIEKQKIKEKVLAHESMAEKAAAESMLTGTSMLSVGGEYYGLGEAVSGRANIAPGPGAGFAGRGYGGRGGRGGRGLPVRVEETHRSADTLNLSEFLAEGDAAERRRIGGGNRY